MGDLREPGQLGGRLTLLRPDTLHGPARQVYERLLALVRPESAEAGYRAVLDDGRLIGPFNAMLRTPELTDGMGGWVAQVSDSGIDPVVRETVILTVGATYAAPFEVYAHTAAARAGLDEETIGAVLHGVVLRHASRRVRLAHRLATALVGSRVVSDELYTEVVDEFGVEQAIAILHLIGQYQLVSSLLVFFDVPAPTS